MNAPTAAPVKAANGHKGERIRRSFLIPDCASAEDTPVVVFCKLIWAASTTACLIQGALCRASAFAAASIAATSSAVALKETVVVSLGRIFLSTPLASSIYSPRFPRFEHRHPRQNLVHFELVYGLFTPNFRRDSIPHGRHFRATECPNPGLNFCKMAVRICPRISAKLVLVSIRRSALGICPQNCRSAVAPK